VIMGRAMTNLRSLTPRTPVAAVDPADLKRVWRLYLDTAASRPAGAAATSAFSIDIRLIERQCSSGSDALAVFLRTTLLQEVVKQELLNDWQQANELRDAVFSTAAVFPLENGIESFDPDALIERLRSSTT